MSIQTTFKWASASIAVIPGLTIILTDLGTPPNISKYLYGGIVEACGAFTLLLLFLNKKKIEESSAKTINRTSILMFVLFFISLLSYIVIFNTQVIYSTQYDIKFFFPFWYGKDLSYMISQAGSKYNAIASYGPQAISDGIMNSQPYVEISSVIFTVMYVLIFEFLVLGFGLLGLRVSDNLRNVSN